MKKAMLPVALRVMNVVVVVMVVVVIAMVSVSREAVGFTAKWLVVVIK